MTKIPPVSEPISEPESSPEPTSRPEPKGEPKPEWTTAFQTWGAAWPCHWIGSAVLFACMFLLAVILLRKLLKGRRNRKTMMKFSITVTAIIAIFLMSRFLYMIFNPYESPSECLFGVGNCPLFLSRLLFSIGVPSLVSAFMLLHLALLDVMKLQKLSGFTKLQNWWFLVGLTTANYIISITADLAVTYKAVSSVFVTLCQGYFILFSLGLVIAFSYTGLSIYLLNKKTKSQVYKMSTRHGGQICPVQARRDKNATRKVARLTMVTSLLGLAYLFSQIYALVMAYGKKSSSDSRHWKWLICQYFYRFVELAMASCLLYNISYMPKHGRKNETTKDRACTNTINSNGAKMNNSGSQ